MNMNLLNPEFDIHLFLIHEYAFPKSNYVFNYGRKYIPGSLIRMLPTGPFIALKGD